MFESYDANPEMKALLDRAAEAYSHFATRAAS